jgi:hypothetical protein
VRDLARPLKVTSTFLSVMLRSGIDGSGKVVWSMVSESGPLEAG